MKSINTLGSFRAGDDYQRDNFDRFLKKISFSYDVPSIHIAGSNGKGSTASYLAKIYEEGGYKVGLFISPALNEINESISINGKLISDSDIISIFNEKKSLIEKCDLSIFETLTYIAFTYFSQEKCDIAIIECGMGGEIDATNIFTPILSIITSISLEHTDKLGKTLSEIAEQKAGIIKDDIPVLVGKLEEDALKTILEVANEKKSHLVETSIPSSIELTKEGYEFDYLTYPHVHISSMADYSVYDACLALDAYEILRDRFSVSLDKIYAGLKKMFIPCRFEIINKEKPIIIDGAHNPESMKKLAISLQKAFPSKRIFCVFTCFKDKNLNSMLSFIGEVVDKLYLTTFPHARARDEMDYFLYADEYPFFLNPLEAIETCLKDEDCDIVLVTGSLAFAGYIKEEIK